MAAWLNRVIDFFASLKLTVVCLAAALVLVFVGTLAQVDQGLYSAQNRFFRSLLVYWTLPGTDWQIPVMPGGYLVGGVLLLNLLAAHLMRFKPSLKNAGNWLTHGGIILLLLGQFATDLLSTETHMDLTEGQTKNYSESDRDTEVVFIDTSNPAFNEEVAIPANLLQPGQEIKSPKLPFTIRVKRFAVNSGLVTRAPMVDKEPPAATQGLGQQLILSNAPPVTSMNFRNLPSTVLELVTPQGSLGTWLASTMLDQKQPLTVAGKTYQLAMRFRRYYKPYSIELLKFRHDVFKGTEIDRNFSSRVRLHNTNTGEDREVLIFMNNPLRYAGETYYQASYSEKNPQRPVTILQVVHNPSWLTPYLSCLLVASGLLIQFMTRLVGFILNRKAV